MQSSLASCHFLPPRSKYFPQHPVLRHPQSCSSDSVRDQVSLNPCSRVHLEKLTPIQNNGYIIVLYTLIFKFREEIRRQKTLNRMVASIP
jgi:hypothetical protein